MGKEGKTVSAFTHLYIVNKIEDVYNDTQHLVGQAENDGVPIVIVRNGTDLLHALLCRVY